MEIELVSDYFINYYIVKKTSMAFSYTYSLFLGFPTSWDSNMPRCGTFYSTFHGLDTISHRYEAGDLDLQEIFSVQHNLVWSIKGMSILKIKIKN